MCRGFDRWSDLSFPSSGDFYTLDRGGGFDTPKDQPLARTQAGGYRGIFDLADPARSRFIIATGQSGHIFSRALPRPAAAVAGGALDHADRERGRAESQGRDADRIRAELNGAALASRAALGYSTAPFGV